MEADNFDKTFNTFKSRSPFRSFTVALVNRDRFEHAGNVVPEDISCLAYSMDGSKILAGTKKGQLQSRQAAKEGKR